jgi:hypothetical protein
MVKTPNENDRKKPVEVNNKKKEKTLGRFVQPAIT